jgi:transcription elongation factor Elf1
MGMFDTVRFDCPRCDAPVEVQSKAAECTLTDFYSLTPFDASVVVPDRVAEDVKGRFVRCDDCEATFKVGAGVKAVVWLEEP